MSKLPTEKEMKTSDKLEAWCHAAMLAFSNMGLMVAFINGHKILAIIFAGTYSMSIGFLLRDVYELKVKLKEIK